MHYLHEISLTKRRHIVLQANM